MNLLSSSNVRNHIQNLIHEDTQLHEKRIDLTVNEIYRFSQPGCLDFGGSEFESAHQKIMNPQKENEDDKYGWWTLNPGRYHAIFNENLNLGKDTMAILTLHDHARQAGLLANTVLLTNENSVDLVFNVPEIGCNIKENARFATAFFVQM